MDDFSHWDMEYYFHRDSLTGCYDRSYACKEYNRIRREKNIGAVMVRATGCDAMPMYKSEEYIRRIAGIIGRICEEKICRIWCGDFMIFSENAEETTDRLRFFLKELDAEDCSYYVIESAIDPNENFDLFIRRMKRNMGIYEISNLTKNT